MSKYKQWLLAVAAAVGVFAMATEGSTSAAEKAPVVAEVATVAADPTVRVMPTATLTRTWWAETMWLNRAETYQLSRQYQFIATIFGWYPPISVGFGTLAWLAGDVYNRGGCIKMVRPRGSNIFIPQNYWGGYCR